MEVIGVFGFLSVAVICSTVASVLNARIAKKPAPGAVSSDQVELLSQEVRDLGLRLHQIEEERDFYKDLLAAPRGSSTPRSTD